MGAKSRALWAYSRIKADKWKAIFGSVRPTATVDRCIKKDKACRGDYALSRDLDKTLLEYRKYGAYDKDAAIKLKNEYYQKQQDYRDKLSRERDRHG